MRAVCDRRRMQAVCDLWNRFSARFVALWDTEAHAEGLAAAAVYAGDARAAAQAQFIRCTLADALRFGGCVMIRRLVGIAHNADFETIVQRGARAVCEERALGLGRELLVHAERFVSIEAVVEEAQKRRAADGCDPHFPITLREPSME
jgi:5-methylthioribose kinase